MTEIIKSSDEQPAPELEADFLIPVEVGRHSRVTKPAAIVAAGVAAVGGVAFEASQAEAAPTKPVAPAAHVQTASEQQTSTNDFLETSRVSAAQLLNLRGARQRHLASVSQHEKLYPKEPEEYTANYLEKMRQGEIQFGYFNGTVTVDNEVKIYSFMDPELRSSGKDSVLNQYPWWNTQQLEKQPNTPTITNTINKFGGGFRPAVLFDSKNNVWLAFSIESGGYRGGDGVSGQSTTSPNLQLDLLFYIPLKGNEGHIKFYLSEPDEPTFLGGAVRMQDNIFSQGGNFMSVTPGYQTEKADFFAEWTTDTRYGKTQLSTDKAGDGPAFWPLAWEKSLITNQSTGKAYKEYKMPSAAKIKKLIQAETPTSD